MSTIKGKAAAPLERPGGFARLYTVCRLPSAPPSAGIGVAFPAEDVQQQQTANIITPKSPNPAFPHFPFTTRPPTPAFLSKPVPPQAPHGCHCIHDQLHDGLNPVSQDPCQGPKQSGVAREAPRTAISGWVRGNEWIQRPRRDTLANTNFCRGGGMAKNKTKGKP